MPGQSDRPDDSSGLPADDPSSMERDGSITPLVYDELRRIARAHMANLPPGQTLQPTALVHEAYLRLARASESGWDCKEHFVSAVSKAMRYFLVDEARRKGSLKRGGDRQRVLLDDIGEDADSPIDLLALDEVARRLESSDPRKGEVLNLRLFGGLTLEETASTLGISHDTARREWRFVRRWLAARLADTPDEGTDADR